ncbi:DegT/DnrJ/EryC1/StrS family aminotransferase [Haloparvum alkalitolerans]|uniref:DegT/DnrJ/EryC1/StrS family aminotransferase n=1 Tax=Haloparvum alkalitolerans TaxID=1042953 RepID=UPI003CF43C1B
MVPLADPQVDRETIEHVSSLLASGDLSTGEAVEEFEQTFGAFSDRKYATAVCSGSVALEMALEAVFDSGSRIALSPYNCGATLYSVLRAGLQPAFVDAEPDSCGIDPESLSTVGTSVDGVLVAHLFGEPSRVDDLLTVSDANDITVVEDFAQAPGAEADGRVTGSIGTVSVCSFGATKNITTAEGGVVLSDDPAIEERVSRSRSNTDDVSPPPRSVRMNDIEATIGLGQLENYDETVGRKRHIAEIYRQVSDIGRHPATRQGATNVYHAYPIRHADADRLADHLEAHDIGTSRLYSKPLHEYDEAPSVDRSFPVAEALSAEIVLLPIHAGMSEADAKEVVATLESF